MTKLVLSLANSHRLRQLVQQTQSDHHAVQSLRHALEQQPQNPKMTTHSPAIPSSISTEMAPPLVLDHKHLISIASWAQSDAQQNKPIPDPAALKLSSLVTGSHVYIPPKPVFQRSKELEESIAAIRRAQEQAEYQRMSTTSTRNSSGYKIPTSYVNISGVDPTLSLTQRMSSQTASPHLTFHSSSSANQLREGEEQAWKDAQRQLSVILNIFLSTLATATAAWWASGNASAAHKVLVSMMVGLITAVAEIVLYNRYSVYVNESKKIKSNRMKGSDLNKAVPDFKPLQFDRGSAKRSDRTASEGPKREPS